MMMLMCSSLWHLPGKNDTVVIGDDTDFLVLLLRHAELDSHELFLAPEPKQSSKKNRVS